MEYKYFNDEKLDKLVNDLLSRDEVVAAYTTLHRDNSGMYFGFIYVYVNNDTDVGDFEENYCQEVIDYLLDSLTDYAYVFADKYGDPKAYKPSDECEARRYRRLK